MTVAVDFAEPEGGIVATLAGLEGTPAVSLTVNGDGTLDDLTVDIALDAADDRLLEGEVVLAGTPEGRRVTADLDGAFAPLLPASLREFVGASSKLDLVALQREGGGLTVERFVLDSGEVQAEGSLRTAADGFLEALDVEANLAAADDGRVTLPGGAAVGGARVTVDYGGEDWTALARVTDLDAGRVAAGEAVIEASGTLSNANDPAARAVTFTVDGDVRELSSPDEALAAALGRNVRLDASGAWNAGEPVRLDAASLTAKAARVALQGIVRELAFEGAIDVDAASLAPFSALAGRDLAGSLALDANGRLAPLTGAFDLTLDGRADGLETGIEAVDGLLGDTTIAGRLARGEEGIVAERFRLDGRALDVTADGTLGSQAADLTATIALDDLAALSEEVSGAATVEARVVGTEGRFDLDLTGRVPESTLKGRDLADASFAFDGTLDGGDLRGAVSGAASLGGEPVRLEGELATLGEIRQIEGLRFVAGEATLTGDVRQNADGLFEGRLALDASDVSTLGALALTDASGAARADIELSVVGAEQAASIEGTLRNLVVGGNRVGEGDVALEVTDLFGVPTLDGSIEATRVEAGGVRVDDLDVAANGTPQRTAFVGSAQLNGDTSARLAGAIRPLAAEPAIELPQNGEAPASSPETPDAPRRFALELTQLALARREATLTLAEPTSITVADGTVTLDDLVARVAGGTLRASGSAGERLDLTLALESIGLDVADTVRPDLGLTGTLTGEARVTGTPADPEATFSLTGGAVSAAVLEDGGVAPLDLALRGEVTDGTLRIPGARIENDQGVMIEGNATVPVMPISEASLSANLAIEALPLSVANGFREGLGASGTVAGFASVSGSLGAPEATFRLAAREATVEPLREAGIEPLALDVSGAFADDRVRLSEGRLANPQGIAATIAGTVPLSGGGLDIDVELDDLPLAIGGLAVPDLGLSGRVRGSASLMGTLREPRGPFSLVGTDVSAAPLREAGVAPLRATIEGELTADGVALERARVENAQGLLASLAGNVPLGADDALDLTAEIEALPLALADAVRPGLDASGTVRGTARVTGTFAAPNASFDVAGEGLTANPLREAGVTPLEAAIEGRLEGRTLTLETARIDNDQSVSLDASGTVPLAAQGTLDVEARLAEIPLSLANAVRPDLALEGRVGGRLDIAGTLASPTGTFDLAGTSITAAPLRTNGIAPLDVDLAGELTGDAVRLDEARATNDQGLAARATGTVPLSPDGPLDVDIELEALPLSLADTVRPELGLRGVVSGRASVEGTIASPRGAFDIEASGLSAAPLRSNGIEPLDLRAEGSSDGRVLTLDDALVTNGQGLRATASGTVPLDGTGEIDIDLDVEEAPLSIANAARPELGLGGTVSARAELAGPLTAPRGTFEVSGRDVAARVLRQNGIEPLDVAATGSTDGRTLTLDTANVTNGQGLRATASGTVPLDGSGEVDIDVDVADAPLSIANAARPELGLSGRVSATASLTGPLTAPRGRFDVTGRGVSARALVNAGVAPLDLDVAGSTDGRSVRLDEALVTNRQGVRVTARGTVPIDGAGTLGIDVTLDDTPLSIANAVAPDLGLGGRVSGRASLGGSLASPVGSFDVTGTGITAAPLRQNGISPLALDVAGSLDGTRVRLERASVTNGQGIAVAASGTLPTSPDGVADIDVRLNALPLSVVNAARPGLGLAGTIAGDASVSGRLTDPDVTFDLAGSGISANPLATNGILPVSLAASGAYENRTVRLSRLDVSNGQGVDVEASGTIPLSGSLSVQLQATAPLSLADRFLADRGARVGGFVTFSGSVTGPLADPSVNGLISTQNASFVDPLANLRLSSVDVLASVSDNRVTFNSSRAVLASGGTVSLGVSLTLDGRLPAELVIVLDGARYADGQLVAATVDGRLTITGALLDAPLIAGRIDVREADITVPDALAASSDVLQVRHVMPPLDVVRTLARARLEPSENGVPVPRTRPGTPRLDILVSAPNQIFVRGRGLDAEVGGEVRVRGPITDVSPTGAFDLIRGRLSILTQRITFERGRVTLVGDLDPFIDFRASTISGDVLVIVSVTGRASDLSITFSSEPDLPQDEVLARLIFDRGLDELSPLQIARLAAAAAELAGGGEGGLFASLREATGLDDIDVTTDAEGNAAVRAGRYINDNIYLGVEAGAGGGRVTIDLDITNDLKARATTGPDESTLGVFFEKDF